MSFLKVVIVLLILTTISPFSTGSVSVEQQKDALIFALVNMVYIIVLVQMVYLAKQNEDGSYVTRIDTNLVKLCAIFMMIVDSVSIVSIIGGMSILLVNDY